MFCLGWNAGGQELQVFKRAISTVPGRILQSRLKIIARSRYDGFQSRVPAVYIGASRDRLVPAAKVEEFKQAFPGILVKEIEGPHFLLQACPKAGAAAIVKAVSLLG